MSIRTRLSLILLILCNQTLMYGQCPTYIAGFNCSSAPVICDLKCLDGFVGQMQDTSSAFIKLNKASQPDPLCNTGGRAQNMSWFAFIAGDTSASIKITPFNCKNNDGIQAGMFGDCNFADNKIGNVPVDNEFFDCKDNFGLSVLTLQSNRLKIGQTYYFYVDGNASDVCSYRVNIIDAKQASGLPKMKSFDQPADSIIACVDEKITLSNTSLGLEIEYYWSIDTIGTNNPRSFERTFLNKRDFKFTNKGRYRISLFATNGCTYTDTISKLIIIKDLATERFPAITVCENKLPIAGPKNLDPNNDGVVGWLGPNLIAGENLYRIQYSPTCFYDQRLTVNTLPSVDPIKITLSGCDSVVFKGEVFNGNFADWPVVVNSQNPNGCDTLYEVSTTIYGVSGSIAASSCVGGKVEIKFTESSSSVLPSSVVKYIWTDASNNRLTPSADGKVVLVDYKTRVQLVVWIVNGQDSCRSTINPIDVDPLSTKPAKPVPLNWDLTFCENELVGNFEISPIAQTGNVQWSITSGEVKSNFRKAIVVFEPNVNQTILCVENSNSCGNEKFCDTIRLIKKGVAKILPQYKVCQDSFLVIAPRDIDKKLIWKSNSGQLDYLQNGNISLKYLESGNDRIIVSDTSSGCIYNDTAAVKIISTIERPILNAISSPNKIEVSWQNISCVKYYRISLDGKFVDTTSKTKYIFSQLLKDKEYDVKVEAISNTINDCNCSTSSSSIKGKTGNCNTLKFEVKVPVSSVCEDGWKQRMQLLHSKQGNKEDNKVIWSGNGVDAAGFFVPENAGLGLAKIIGKYEEQGCTYIDTAFINVFTNPVLKLTTVQPLCLDEQFGSIIIQTKDNRPLRFMYLDSVEIKDSIINNLKPATYTITVYDENLCKRTEAIRISPPIKPSLNLLTKDTTIYSGANLSLSTKPNVNADSIVWKVNGNVECDDCDNFIFKATQNGLFNLGINYRYGHCIGQDTLSIKVLVLTKLFMPNILQFSNVNKDNSMFKIGANVPSIRILSFGMFSRWGEMVLHQENFMLEEDAMHIIDLSQSTLQSGVYMINITYEDPVSGLKKSEFRDITILR
jgi:hypothetical protein